MNPNYYFGVIGSGFFNQVPTPRSTLTSILHELRTRERASARGSKYRLLPIIVLLLADCYYDYGC